MTVENETPDSVDTAATENTGTEGLENQEQQEGQAAQQEGGEGQEGEQPKEPEKPKRSRAQERIEQLAREKAELAAKVAAYESKQQTTELKRPVIDDFDDFSKYEEALEDYHAAKAEERVLARLNERESQKAASSQEAEFQVAMDELADEGVDIDSYFKKAESLPQLPVTLDQFGLNAVDTLRLAKQLIDDEQTYHSLSQMTPIQAAAKIGQIIEGNKTKTAPPVSKAPKPIKPVQANAPAARDPSKMSDSEWLEWRKNQVKSKK